MPATSTMSLLTNLLKRLLKTRSDALQKKGWKSKLFFAIIGDSDTVH